MAKMLDSLIVERLIGEDVDAFFPSIKMTVTYNSNKRVCIGHELFPILVTFKLRVEVVGGNLRAFFTLDSYRHPGTTESTFRKELVKYEIPSPNIGIHWFVFLLYKKKRRQTVATPPSGIASIYENLQKRMTLVFSWLQSISMPKGQRCKEKMKPIYVANAV